jgi:hypothetical protein
MRAIALLLAAALTGCGGGSEPELPTHPQFAYLTTCRDATGPFWCEKGDATGPFWCEKGDASANYAAPGTGEWIRMMWCGPSGSFPRDQVLVLSDGLYAVGSGIKLESDFFCLSETKQGYYVPVPTN